MCVASNTTMPIRLIRNKLEDHDGIGNKVEVGNIPEYQAS